MKLLLCLYEMLNECRMFREIRKEKNNEWMTELKIKNAIRLLLIRQSFFAV